MKYILFAIHEDESLRICTSEEFDEMSNQFQELADILYKGDDLDEAFRLQTKHETESDYKIKIAPGITQSIRMLDI